MTDFPAAIYDRITDARRFDTIHEILRPPSLAQSLVKAEMRQFGAAGTDRLTEKV